MNSEERYSVWQFPKKYSKLYLSKASLMIYSANISSSLFHPGSHFRQKIMESYSYFPLDPRSLLFGIEFFLQVVNYSTKVSNMKNGNAASQIKNVKSDATMELNKLMISHSKLKNFHFHPRDGPITFLTTMV